MGAAVALLAGGFLGFCWQLLLGLLLLFLVVRHGYACGPLACIALPHYWAVSFWCFWVVFRLYAGPSLFLCFFPRWMLLAFYPTRIIFVIQKINKKVTCYSYNPNSKPDAIL